MKFLHKMALVALAIVSSTGSMFCGVSWVINNKTNHPVMVRMQLQANNQVYWFLVRENSKLTNPGGLDQAANFSWGVDYCYDSISVQTYDKKMAAEENPKLRNLPYGAYGSNSKPGGCEASAQEVQNYFNRRIWHVPTVIFSESSFDTAKITAAMESLAKSGEAFGKAVLKAKYPGATIPDVELGKLVGSITGLAIEGAHKGKCAPGSTRTFDLYGAEKEIPGTTEKEEAFILVDRANLNKSSSKK